MRAAVVQVDLDARVVLASDDVHHAADSVGAIHGRCAVQQDLNAVHHGQWNGGDVRDPSKKAAIANAAAVHKNQRGFAAQTAQVDCCSAGPVLCSVESCSVSLVCSVDVLRQLAEHPGQGQLSRCTDSLAIKHDQVAGKFRSGTAQATARDRDFPQFQGFLLFIGIGIGIGVFLGHRQVHAKGQAGENCQHPGAGQACSTQSVAEGFIGMFHVVSPQCNGEPENCVPISMATIHLWRAEMGGGMGFAGGVAYV